MVVTARLGLGGFGLLGPWRRRTGERELLFGGGFGVRGRWG